MREAKEDLSLQKSRDHYGSCWSHTLLHFGEKKGGNGEGKTLNKKLKSPKLPFWGHMSQKQENVFFCAWSFLLVRVQFPSSERPKGFWKYHLFIKLTMEVWPWKRPFDMGQLRDPWCKPTPKGQYAHEPKSSEREIVRAQRSVQRPSQCTSKIV